MDKSYISINIVLAVIIMTLGLIVVAKKRSEERIKRLVRLAESHLVIPECFVCFTPASQRCSRCKLIRYCSRQCQTIHWTQGHKYECIKANGEADDPEIVMVNERQQTLRELEEERELVKLLKIECEEMRRSSMRQVKRKERELVNALDAAAIAESESGKARRELVEEQKRVRRLKLKLQVIKRNSIRKVEEVRVAEMRKQERCLQLLETERVNLMRELEQEQMLRLQVEQHEGLQIAKRKAERLSQELANVEYVENGWMKALRELEEERELLRLLEMECEEMRQGFIRQMEKKEQELANALNNAAAAEAKLSELEREVNLLDDKACAICLTNEKDVAFGCGHMCCEDCMLTISICHICREPITNRLKLFLG